MNIFPPLENMSLCSIFPFLTQALWAGTENLAHTGTQLCWTRICLHLITQLGYAIAHYKSHSAKGRDSFTRSSNGPLCVRNARVQPSLYFKTGMYACSHGTFKANDSTHFPGIDNTLVKDSDNKRARAQAGKGKGACVRTPGRFWATGGD